MKPALRRGWRDLSTVQFGMTPAHAMTLGPMDQATGDFLDLLNGTRGLALLREEARGMDLPEGHVDALVDRIEHTWQKRRTWFQERCWSHGNMTAYHLRQIPDDKDDFARKWTNANAYAEAREAGHYGALALAAGADPYQRDPADEVFDDVTF